MRYFRSFLSWACLALAACFGVSSVALADSPSYTAHRFAQAVALTGHYGAESAKFHAEQVYMSGFGESCTRANTGLIAESNGFRMANILTASVASSEVAKGKTGVGAGSIA